MDYLATGVWFGNGDGLAEAERVEQTGLIAKQKPKQRSTEYWCKRRSVSIL